jgi:hypothetical protein
VGKVRCRTIHRADDAKIIAGGNAAIGSHDPIKHRRFGFIGNLFRVGAEGIIPCEVLDLQIMGVYMSACRDVAGSKSDRLTVFF